LDPPDRNRAVGGLSGLADFRNTLSEKVIGRDASPFSSRAASPARRKAVGLPPP
jgi:hypothetical protein